MDLNEAINELMIAAIVFVTTLITVIGPIVRTWLENWLTIAWEERQKQLPENILAIVQEAARIAVLVVEATNLEGQSKVKLKEAEEIAENWLLDLGYEVELDMIREAIEAVLFEMKKDGRM